VVDLFFREGPKEGMSPGDIRAAREPFCTTNRVVIAGETRGPKSVGSQGSRSRGARRDQGYRLRAGRLPLGKAQVEVPLHAQSAHIAQGAMPRQQG
jgi:S-adenosylmethionine synthetase